MIPSWAPAWAANRILGEPKPKGTPVHVGISWDDAWPWLAFVEWRLLRHGLPPKPLSLPRPLPQSWWDSLPQVLKLLPHAPPIPKPPADPFAAFALPVLYVTDAGSGVAFAQKAAEAGFRSLALQNTTYTLADASAVLQAGLDIHTWGIAQTSDATVSLIYGPQIEGPQQADAATAVLRVKPFGARCIITNFGGLGDHPEKAAAVAPLIQATAVECYAVENPNGPYADLARMTNQARIYGLPHPFPVVETIRGVGTEAYPQLADWGPNFGVWRAEQAPEKMWAQVKALLSAPQVSL